MSARERAALWFLGPKGCLEIYHANAYQPRSGCLPFKQQPASLLWLHPQLPRFLNANQETEDTLILSSAPRAIWHRQCASIRTGGSTPSAKVQYRHDHHPRCTHLRKEKQSTLALGVLGFIFRNFKCLKIIIKQPTYSWLQETRLTC